MATQWADEFRSAASFPAGVIEQVCKILADKVTGSEIPNLIAPFNKIPESAVVQH